MGECENILKDKYDIDKNEALIIVKIDYFKPDSLIPIIGYEVFHPKNKSKLNLSYCENELINLNIPVNIDEDNLFKYDPNSEYYTDECYPYTTENGTDILINDRHLEYNDNNMSLCENNCNFIGYGNDTKEAKCECNIKSKQLVISEIMNQTDILYYDNFTDKNLTSNMISMKCYYTLFTKNGLLKNFGSYLLLFTIILFIISGFIVYKCSYFMLEMNIKQILFSKGKHITKYNPTKKFKKKTQIIKNKNGKLKKNYNSTKTALKDLNIYSFSKLDINRNNIIKYTNKKNKKNKKSNKIYNFNDYELNSLSYKEALKYDKRTFSNYYISLIKTKQPLIFSFYPIKDYNIKIVKIDLFFLFFSIYYFINTLFFNESVIHKIYEQKGIYNISYLIPKILYSFIISHFLCTLIKYIFLSERNISEINKEMNENKAREISEIIKKRLVIKYICFYVLGLFFLLFLWYYLSSFSAVYKNTQIYLIKNCLICFAISLLYPFIINLFPSFLRNYSLINNKKCVYEISKIFQLI